MLKIIDSMLDLIYPKKCLFCNSILITDNMLCDNCENLILPVCKTARNLCRKCSYPLKEDDEGLCKICKGDKRYFAKNVSVYPYTDPVKHTIHRFKYNNATYLKQAMATIMADYVLKNYKINFNYLISVPMSKERLKERGYNQTDLLTEIISKRLNIDILQNVIIRQINTKEQHQFDVSNRKKNLEDAFLITDADKIKQKTLLIVDDIFTSGATVNEMSKQLMQNGAKEVYSITFAIAGMKM